VIDTRIYQLAFFTLGVLALGTGIASMGNAYEVGGYLQRGFCHFLTIVGSCATLYFGCLLVQS
jgi:hypothetical protein